MAVREETLDEEKVLNQSKSLRYQHWDADCLPGPEYLVWKHKPTSTTTEDKNSSPTMVNFFLYSEFRRQKDACLLGSGYDIKETPLVFYHKQRSWTQVPALWWPREVFEMYITSTWFNLDDTFLNMVFKPFADENVSNRFAWTFPLSAFLLSPSQGPGHLPKVNTIFRCPRLLINFCSSTIRPSFH